jgi:hypothetical protein
MPRHLVSPFYLITSFVIQLSCTKPKAILELGSSFQTVSAFFQISASISTLDIQGKTEKSRTQRPTLAN